MVEIKPPKQALIIRDLIVKTGNPVGIPPNECYSWFGKSELERSTGRSIYTGCLYQIMGRAGLPSKILEVMEKSEVLTETLKGIVSRLASRFWKITPTNTRYVEALRGIVEALKTIDPTFSYLGNLDRYPGILLLDLGFIEEFYKQATMLIEGFERESIRELVTVDPHTTEALRIAVKISNSKIKVRHYIEVLFDKLEKASYPGKLEVVLHDPCILARTLNLHGKVRSVLRRIEGLKFLEPRRSGLDTYCCGGPLEFYKPTASRSICLERIGELKSTGTSTILVLCPICMFNFSKWGKGEVEVLDLGNVLGESSL